jgi:hypothetical protein
LAFAPVKDGKSGLEAAKSGPNPDSKAALEFSVMAGLVPAIHGFLSDLKFVDVRHKARHDEDS